MLQMIEYMAIIIAVIFLIAAIIIRMEIKSKKLTTYKAHPTSLYPSVFFSMDNPKIKDIETKVVSETQIKRKDSSVSIAKSIRELLPLYEKEIRKMNVPDGIRQKISLCQKTIEMERECFKTDNGETSSDFTMNRQNDFTNFLMTGIMVPILVGAINIDANSVQGFITAITDKPILLLLICVLLVLFCYRVYKYFRNKRSMLKSWMQICLYNKAELLLNAFEIALNQASEDED